MARAYEACVRARAGARARARLWPHPISPNISPHLCISPYISRARLWPPGASDRLSAESLPPLRLTCRALTLTLTLTHAFCVEGDLDELAEAGGVVVASGLRVAKSLEDRVGREDRLRACTCMCMCAVCMCIRGSPASLGAPWLPEHGATRTTAASGSLGPAVTPSVSCRPAPNLPPYPKPTSLPQAFRPAPSLPACPKPSGLP